MTCEMQPNVMRKTSRRRTKSRSTSGSHLVCVGKDAGSTRAWSGGRAVMAGRLCDVAFRLPGAFSPSSGDSSEGAMHAKFLSNETRCSVQSRVRQRSETNRACLRSPCRQILVRRYERENAGCYLEAITGRLQVTLDQRPDDCRTSDKPIRHPT